MYQIPISAINCQLFAFTDLFYIRNESQLFRVSWDMEVVTADTIRLGAHAVRHPSVYPSKTFPYECCKFTAIASSLPQTDFVYPLAI